MILRNFEKEVEDTVKCLSQALSQTLVSKQFSASIWLGAIHLSLVERKICKTDNLSERRKHIDEFDRAKRAVQKGIMRLRECAFRERGNSGQSSGAMP